MSDTYRRYAAIKQGLLQFYQPRPSHHQERHLNTLVALICGLSGSQRAHLSSIANHAPSHGADQESLSKMMVEGQLFTIGLSHLCAEKQSE